MSLTEESIETAVKESRQSDPSQIGSAKALDLKPGPKSQDQTSAELAAAAAKIALEEKALDVRPLNLAGSSDIAESFLIASATSDRHAKNIADKIRLHLKEFDEVPLNGAQFLKNNLESSEWIVLDYGHLIVHVFYEPVRQFYKLDELWKDAKLIELDARSQEISAKQRTGIYAELD